MDVSVIIPARNEKFLQKTIAGILEKAKSEIEVIAVLDGYWPDLPLIDDKRITLIHYTPARGMRPAINAAADIARGKYLMKIDAHCLFDEGFDIKLMADCEPDWLAVPRRYSLDEDNWVRKENKVIDYMYLSAPNPPKEEGFHGIRWKGYERGKEDILIDDAMSFQGSCWFMYREQFFKLGCMDLNYGQFAQEAQELGMKFWLSGGRVVRNKKTWYAHLHKGKRHGRGYFLNVKDVRKSHEYSLDLWLNNLWPGRIFDFDWFVDKFKAPGWEQWKKSNIS